MNQGPRLQPHLRWFDATSLVVGSMIGSGIFVAPAIMAQWVQSPGVLVAVWVFGGIFTLLGALAFAELSAMAPLTGGQYVFLRQAFGPFVAFSYGWTLFLVIQTGFIAAVAIAFAKYLGVFMPAIGEKMVIWQVPLASLLPEAWGTAHWPVFLQAWSVNTAQLVACGLIVVLTAINMLGVKTGALVQNIFTVLKVAALIAVIGVGLTNLPTHTDHFQPLFSREIGTQAANVGFVAALAVVLSKALFAYDSWNTVTFLAEEVQEPEKTLPRALFAGCICVTLIYVLANVAYLAVVPIQQMDDVPEGRIAQELAHVTFGTGGVRLIVMAILISTFGCVNGLVLSGARVLFAMAREGMFFPSCATLHAESHTPRMALLVQGAWSCVLAMTGSYDVLLTYTTSAAVFFGGLTVACIFRFRAVEPERPRPYRCWGYPFTPALYLLIALAFLIYVVQGDPFSALMGLGLVATGIPFYWKWARKSA